jgi:hypothetical protein
VLAGNPQKRGDLGFGLPGCRDYLAQQFAGMCRASARIAFGGIFGHHLGSSVVLLEIDAESMSRVELESDAPRPVDMNRVAHWHEAFQGVKIKSGKVHLLWHGRSIEAIKTDQNAPVHLGVDLCRAALCPQLG